MSALPVSHEVGQRQHDRLACLGSPAALSNAGPVQPASTAITASSTTGRALLAIARSLPQARSASAPACYGSIRRTPTRADPRTAAGSAGLTLEELQGAPGVAAGMRCLTSDPRCRSARAGSPDRRPPCDDCH
jgi:hypothetical protein